MVFGAFVLFLAPRAGRSLPKFLHFWAGGCSANKKSFFFRISGWVRGRCSMQKCLHLHGSSTAAKNNQEILTCTGAAHVGCFRVIGVVAIGRVWHGSVQGKAAARGVAGRVVREPCQPRRRPGHGEKIYGMLSHVASKVYTIIPPRARTEHPSTSALHQLAQEMGQDRAWYLCMWSE